jgi:HEAT repeat protein
MEAKLNLSWKDKSDVVDRQFAMADARCRVAARALGQLGDPRALAALTEVVEKQSFGTRKAAKRAIDQINQRRSVA